MAEPRHAQSGAAAAGLLAAPLRGRTIGAPGSSIVVAEWSDPGGGREPPLYIAPLHVHHEDDEAWYVLEGTLCVRLGDDVAEAPAGAAVLAPRGTVHTYWNPSAAPARYLLVMTPRIEGLIAALHSLEERNEQTAAATFERFASTYLGWP